MKLQNAISAKLSIVLFLTVFFSVSLTARAAPGDVDLSFNAGTFTNFTGSGLSINDVEIQADGKTIIGGVFEKINGVTNWSIARLNPDGSLDTSFQSPFIYTVTQTQVSDIALLPGGKILVNGSLITPSGTKRLMRLNPDGTIDSTFSVDPSVGGGADIFVEPNGEIIVSNGSNTVWRLTPDGAVITSFIASNNSIRGLIAAPPRILVAEYGNNFSLVRGFFYDGQLDSSFHVPVANNRIDDIQLQPDGKVLISGNFTQVDSLPKSGVVRLNPDNFVDTSFNTPISLGTVSATKTQSDGKIILVGLFLFNGDSTLYVTARLNPDGSLDSSFIRSASSPNVFSLNTVNMQADGKILVGGSFSEINGFPRQYVARLLASGTSNTPPSLSNIAATTPINENGTATLSGNIADADAGDSFTLTVDWGDGSVPQNFNYAAGTTSFSETHQYLDDNPTATASDNYTISLALSDNAGGSTTASTTITVNNAAPVLSGIAASPATITVGNSTTLSGSVSDVGTLDTHRIVISWGDGSADTTLNLAAGVSTFSASHQYNTSGAFNIGVTATDDDTGTASGGASVTVNPLPPATAPAAPTNLTATAVSTTQINLAWTDNSNSEDGFLIERCAGNGRCTNFIQITQTAANVNVFFDIGLSAATNYTYRIRAFNAGGNSAYSNTAKAKTLRR